MLHLVFKLLFLGNLDTLGELVKISSNKETDDVEGDEVSDFDEGSFEKGSEEGGNCSGSTGRKCVSTSRLDENGKNKKGRKRRKREMNESDGWFLSWTMI